MIIIESDTSIEDIDGKWVPKGQTIEFLLKRESSFQCFAEPYATAFLREIFEEGCFIKVFMPDTESLNELIKGSDEFVDHPILSIFGLQLIFVSKVVVFRSNENKDLRAELGKSIWRYLLKFGLSVGAGRKIQYIANHVRPVPIAFGNERKVGHYASYQNFKSEFSQRLINVWSDSDIISEDNISKISGIAFHAAENAYDHARSNNGRSIRGYYGISLEKLVFESIDKIKERQSLPVLLKNYLTENFNSINLGTGGVMKVQILTVSDIGNGIQNTLSVSGKNGATEIIRAAFDDLVTSKLQTDDDERPGFGLGDIASLARNLKSLLYIQSCEYELFQDFSDEPEKMTEEQKRKVSLSDYGIRKKKYGTCFSLVWIVQSDKVQPGLFDETI